MIVALLIFIYADILIKLFQNWLSDENYSHGLLIPFVVSLIVWFDRKKIFFNRNPQVVLGLLVILLAFLFLLFGTLASELFLQRASFIIMLAGIVIYFWGLEVLNLLFVAFTLLAFSIPLPQIVFNKLTFPLQLTASQIAIRGVRLFGIPSIVKGNVIEILPVGATQAVALEVVEACSGIRSLMTLASLAVLICYFTREEPIRFSLKSFEFWHLIILITSAIPIAVIANAFRVTFIGVLTYFYGRQATEGLFHDLSGWLVYILAFLMLIFVNVALKRLLRGN
ncbi:MAG: exosortase/archaeosortase family protein [Pyrinomonadaceae bacterium]|nr:exosortase/archaeosortase family protein [Pyrinomonadaceae bacterium]